jgi:hypothetical protein
MSHSALRESAGSSHTPTRDPGLPGTSPDPGLNPGIPDFPDFPGFPDLPRAFGLAHSPPPGRAPLAQSAIRIRTASASQGQALSAKQHVNHGTVSLNHGDSAVNLSVI